MPKNDFCINFYYKKKLRFFGVLFEHSEAEGETCVPIKPSLAIINRFLLIRKAGERLQNKGMRASSIRRILLIPSLRQNFRYLPGGAYLRSQPSWSGKQICILSSQQYIPVPSGKGRRAQATRKERTSTFPYPYSARMAHKGGRKSGGELRFCSF